MEGQNPNIKCSDGTPTIASPAEQVLNWQSENAVAQNKLLQNIARTQTRLEEKVDRILPAVLTSLQQMEKRMADLQKQIQVFKADRQNFYHLEQELKKLKVQYPSVLRMAQDLHQNSSNPHLPLQHPIPFPTTIPI